jgi:D-cysteine desulfhydrase
LQRAFSISFSPSGPTAVRELGLGIGVKGKGGFGPDGWGSNKVRKLAWLTPDAQRRGRRSLLSFGGLAPTWA